MRTACSGVLLSAAAVTACLWCAGCAGSQPTEAPTPPEPQSGIPVGEAKSDRYFVGYYRADNLNEGSMLPLDRIHYDKYTHIIHIGLSFGESGVLNLSEGLMPSAELTCEAHKHGVLVLVSLVGSKKHFETVSHNEQLLEPFVRRMTELVEANDYDGIDVDWEHPDSPTAGKGWMKFMQALREALDGLGDRKRRRYWLTSALPAGWSGAHLDGKVVTETVDFLNVMCYDGFGPWGGRAGNHAPLFPDREDPRGISMAKGMAYWRDKVGVPADKLVMGLPFYAYVCRGYKPYEKIDRNDKSKSVDGGSTWSGIQRLISEQGWERRFDQESQAAWYFSPDGNAFVAADDPEIIRIKVKWAREQGFRGVFMWSMRCDIMPDGSRPLLEAMYEAWVGGE